MEDAPSRPTPAALPGDALAGTALAGTALPIALSVDGAREPSETSCERLCAYGLTLTTRLPARALGIELCSEYVGYADASARSTHMATCHARPETDWHAVQHPPRALDVRTSPRACLYDHFQRLQDFLARLGHAVTIELDDSALVRLDQAAQDGR